MCVIGHTTVKVIYWNVVCVTTEKSIFYCGVWVIQLKKKKERKKKAIYYLIAMSRDTIEKAIVLLIAIQFQKLPTANSNVCDTIIEKKSKCVLQLTKKKLLIAMCVIAKAIYCW